MEIEDCRSTGVYSEEGVEEPSLSFPMEYYVISSDCCFAEFSLNEMKVFEICAEIKHDREVTRLL